MKYLLIIAALLLVGGFLYWRLRPYLSMARRALKMLRDIRVQTGGRPADLPRTKASATPEMLVRCDSCGTWTPSSRALKLHSSSNVSYCSHACIERAAASPRPAKKSAS